jgi:hypothetical protein
MDLLIERLGNIGDRGIGRWNVETVARQPGEVFGVVPAACPL